MRAILFTAVIAGFVGLSAGVWLKSTLLVSAAVIERTAAAMVPHELMRTAPANLPVSVVQDPM